VRIGNLRERLEFQTVTETRTSVGGITRTWAESFTVWGRAVFMAGRELEAAEKINAASHLKFEVRYRTDITTKMRVVWRSSHWNIHSVEPDERKTVTVLRASEVE
jgi:SPP1 family predicted phage head-tail adaptor